MTIIDAKQKAPQRRAERTVAPAPHHDILVVEGSERLVAAEDQALEPLIDSVRAASFLGGLHPKTVLKKARSGELPSYRVFNRRFFRESELDDWLKFGSNIASQSARSE